MKVKRSGGGYIDVPFLPEVVLVNLGILMQMWTGDTYLATVSCSFPAILNVLSETPAQYRAKWVAYVSHLHRFLSFKS